MDIWKIQPHLSVWLTFSWPPCGTLSLSSGFGAKTSVRLAIYCSNRSEELLQAVLTKKQRVEGRIAFPHSVAGFMKEFRDSRMRRVERD